MFSNCSLAKKGKIIVIGFIEGYENDFGISRSSRLSMLPAIVSVVGHLIISTLQGLILYRFIFQLLRKSASVRGFFLFDYARDMPNCISDLIRKVDQRELQSFVDDGGSFAKGPFKSMESVFDAVEVRQQNVKRQCSQ